MKIAVIGGDGTGPEVAAEGVKVLKAVAKLEGFEYELTDFDFGGERYLRTGEILPAGAVDELPPIRRDPPRRGRPSRRRAGHPRKGPAAGPAVPVRPVHQPPPGEAVPRRRDAAGRQGPGGHRLRRRPREHRRHVRRRGRLPEEGHARRSRHADGRLHPQGLRALHPLGLRVHPQATTRRSSSRWWPRPTC